MACKNKSFHIIIIIIIMCWDCLQNVSGQCGLPDLAPYSQLGCYLKLLAAKIWAGDCRIVTRCRLGTLCGTNFSHIVGDVSSKNLEPKVELYSSIWRFVILVQVRHPPVGREPRRRLGKPSNLRLLLGAPVWDIGALGWSLPSPTHAGQSFRISMEVVSVVWLCYVVLI